MADGNADMTMDPAHELLYAMDTRPSLVAIAGIRSGCYELLGHDRVKMIRDLKGKRSPYMLMVGQIMF